MNKELINIDGKTIVENDEGIKKEIICSNDLKEILIKENNVELLNKKMNDLHLKIESLTKKIKQEKKSNKKTKRELIVVNILMPILIYTVCRYGNQLANFDILIYATIASVSSIGVSGWVNYMNKNEIKNMENELTSNELLQKELAGKFVKEKSALKKLKEKNDYVVDKEIQTIKLRENNELDNALEFYDYLISNYKVLKEEFERGTLENKLKDYGDDKIDMAYKYFNNNENKQNIKVKK